MTQLTSLLIVAADEFPTVKVVILSIVGLLFLSVFYIFIHFFRLWIQCKLTNAKISLMDLLYMTFKKAPPKMIVMSKIMAVKAGFPNDEENGITADMLVAHHLSGGNVPTVIRAMIAAQKAKIIDLSFREAMAIDRAGRIRGRSNKCLPPSDQLSGVWHRQVNARCRCQGWHPA